MSITDKQYKAFSGASYGLRKIQQGSKERLPNETELDLAVSLLKDTDGYITQTVAHGRKREFAEQDIKVCRAAVAKYRPNADTPAASARPAPRPVTLSLPWVRCNDFVPRGHGDAGCGEFKALRSAEFAYNQRYEAEKPSQRLVIPDVDPRAGAHPQERYNADKLIKAGDAERVVIDGQPQPWLKLTPQFFARHGYEYTSDNQQIKPTLKRLREFFSQLSSRQLRDGVLYSSDNELAEELLRVGLAEVDGNKYVKITPDNFRAMGLGDADNAEPETVSAASTVTSDDIPF